jgi:hypothetical protein
MVCKGRELCKETLRTTVCAAGRTVLARSSKCRHKTSTHTHKYFPEINYFEIRNRWMVLRKWNLKEQAVENLERHGKISAAPVSWYKGKYLNKSTQNFINSTRLLIKFAKTKINT